MLISQYLLQSTNFVLSSSPWKVAFAAWSHCAKPTKRAARKEGAKDGTDSRRTRQSSQIIFRRRDPRAISKAMCMANTAAMSCTPNGS